MSDIQLNPFKHRGTITIASSNTTFAGTEVLTTDAYGMTKHILMVTPEMEGTDSTNLEIQTSDGIVFCETGTQAEKGTTSTGTQVILLPADEVVVTAEGTQSADVDIVYEIRGQR
jgi:hypothetical protein